MPKYIMTIQYVIEARTRFEAIWKYGQKHPTNMMIQSFYVMRFENGLLLMTKKKKYVNSKYSNQARIVSDTLLKI